MLLIRQIAYIFRIEAMKLAYADTHRYVSDSEYAGY